MPDALHPEDGSQDVSSLACSPTPGWPGSALPPLPLQCTPPWSLTRTAPSSSPGPRRGKPQTTLPTAQQVVPGGRAPSTCRTATGTGLCAGERGVPACCSPGPGARCSWGGWGGAPGGPAPPWFLLSERPRKRRLCFWPPDGSHWGGGGGGGLVHFTYGIPYPIGPLTDPPQLVRCPWAQEQAGLGGSRGARSAGRPLRHAALLSQSEGRPLGAEAGQACSRGDQSGLHRDRAGGRCSQAVPAGEEDPTGAEATRAGSWHSGGDLSGALFRPPSPHSGGRWREPVPGPLTLSW